VSVPGVRSIRGNAAINVLGQKVHRAATFQGKLIQMKYASFFLAIVFLAFTGARAQSNVGVQKMLRDASVYHDEERIRSLIAREVDAENRHDYVALKQVMMNLGNATGRAIDGPK